MSRDDAQRGRQAFWWTVAAFVWSAALIGAAVVVPVYGASSASSPGAEHSGGLTLVAVNGLGALIVLSVPLVFVSLAWVALHRKCARGSRLAGYVAGGLLAVLASGCVLALATVGMFVAPVAVLLARAIAITPLGGHAGGPQPSG